jgi:hypothetical protein
VPTELQGRYFGVDQLGTFAVVPVGQVLGALTIQTLGVEVDFLVVAAGVFFGFARVSADERNAGVALCQGQIELYLQAKCNENNLVKSH